jgi:hypothetical protein
MGDGAQSSNGLLKKMCGTPASPKPRALSSSEWVTTSAYFQLLHSAPRLPPRLEADHRLI